MDSSDKFLGHYQKDLFQETKNDLFKTADVKRKCIAHTFKTAVNIFDNTTTCDFLDEMLTSYSDIVDDQNGINNYADALQVLTSQVQRECSSWKSNLDSIDIKDFIKPLPCGGVNCKNSEITEEQIEILFEKNENEPPNNFKMDNNVQNVNTKFGNNSKTNEIENTGNNVKIMPEKRKKIINLPNYNFSSDGIKPLENPHQNFTKSNRQISTTNFNGNNKQLNSKSTDNPQEDKKKFGCFKTARDEYVQQMNKQGGNGQSTSGPQKKSLGARRGVGGKFVPPGKKAYDENEGLEENEEIDERLRNIDPKMVELIRSEIMECGPPITWEDIAGLEFAKTAIKEAVVWPLLRPDIFTGLRRPPKGILLFGPPGTGKTLIGKCIASQSQSTFFSISASSLTSKWIGDGEKMVRAMFAVARCHQPAVIFIDEIDSLLSQRSDSEHESSRRIKTEFLVQLDGAATAEEDRILLVGATNRPQELDEAARRRFVKRLYIPLPEKMARLQIIQRLMGTEKNSLSENNMNEIAELTDGFSGADMKSLCSEASLGPIRSIDISLIANIHADEVGAVTMTDFKNALNRIRASVSPSDLDQYLIWNKTYGSGGW